MPNDFNFYLNLLDEKIDGIINQHNSEAVEKIKNIVGHKHFEELMDETRAHYDDFFGIVEEENNVEENDVVEQETTKEE